MQNYPENLWESAKVAWNVPPDLEHKMKAVFLSGMYTGHQLGLQSTKLPDRTCVEFNTELLAQLKGGLAALGHKPPHINLNTGKILTRN